MSNSRNSLLTDIVLLAGLFALAFRLDGSRRDRGTDASGATLNDSELRPSQEPHRVHESRKSEPGRGRAASSPTGITGTGWMDVLWRIYNQLQKDRLLAVAAGVVFYMLLALFPALTALVSLYGLVSDPAEINAQLSVLAGVVPNDVVAIIRDQVTRVSEARSGSLGLGFLIGLAFALWSTNGGMKAIIDSLNVVYDEREKRSFVKLTLVSFAFTIGSLVFVFLALAAVVVTPILLPWLGLETVNERIISLLRWPALLIVVLLWLALLYRYGPSRTAAQWQWLSIGSVFAALCWLAASSLFSWYLSNFANYNATYGSLGAVIGLMMWLWVSVIIVLFGAELNAELEHQTAEDTTVRPEQPLGARGAVMADTVGKAWH
ncbi:YihY/virulence factor BrkB family protein [Methyloceanibacter caenitepidi]|nr:YihY/virulence factor BrkB family protein [Methyloceanibacter caenitepidi]